MCHQIDEGEGRRGRVERTGGMGGERERREIEKREMWDFQT